MMNDDDEDDDISPSLWESCDQQRLPSVAVSQCEPPHHSWWLILLLLLLLKCREFVVVDVSVQQVRLLPIGSFDGGTIRDVFLPWRNNHFLELAKWGHFTIASSKFVRTGGVGTSVGCKPSSLGNLSRSLSLKMQRSLRFLFVCWDGDRIDFKRLVSRGPAWDYFIGHVWLWSHYRQSRAKKQQCKFGNAVSSHIFVRLHDSTLLPTWSLTERKSSRLLNARGLYRVHTSHHVCSFGVGYSLVGWHNRGSLSPSNSLKSTAIV